MGFSLRRISMSDEVQRIFDQTPPGQRVPLIDALKGLIGEDYAEACGDETAHLQRVNENHSFAVDVPGYEHKVLITPHGRRDAPNQYLDPRGPRMLTVDHASGEVTDVSELSPSDVEEDLESFRANVDDAVQKYLANSYTLGKGVCTVYASREGAQACITVCISSLHCKLKSFWAGRFASEWKVSFDPAAPAIETSCAGRISLHTHYFEDGNVQMQSSRNDCS